MTSAENAEVAAGLENAARIEWRCALARQGEERAYHLGCAEWLAYAARLMRDPIKENRHG